jgi:hypothetical protein
LLNLLARGERSLGRVQVIGWPDEQDSTHRRCAQPASI